VISRAITRIASIVVISASTVGAWPHRKGQRSRVRFLASSTLIRMIWACGEDRYFAELTFAVNDELLLARLSDSEAN